MTKTSPDMPEQLTFDLPVHVSRAVDDFFIAPSNKAAFAMVENWRDWPGKKLILTGPAGAGKSHLAQIWAGMSGAVVLRGDALARADIPALAGQSVLVEDADLLASDAGEAALFHLHNLVLAEGGSLLITAGAAPNRWGLTLPDLASRMGATPLVALEAPDDMLISAVLVKLFDDRQIAVKPALISYLAPRLPRSLAQVAAFVARLDAEALTQGRAVNRQLAGELLNG